MSLSPKRDRRLSLGASLFLLPSVFAPKVQARSCPETMYGEAIKLFGAAYPELRGRGALLDLQAHPFLDSRVLPLNFDISISELRPDAPMHKSISSADKFGHLVAHFQFDERDCRIFSFVASGTFLNGEKQEALTKLINQNPDWSETQMAEALSAAGAKFTPSNKGELLEKFPTKDLEPMLGKIHIVSAGFTFRGNDKPPFYAVMEWDIRFQATFGKHQDEYNASLEPFGGRITSLIRRRVH